MTTPWRPAADATGPARDADRIGDAWDALVAGHRPLAPDPVADDTAELIALAGLLTAVATATYPTPTSTFRTDLRETLMHSGTIPLPTAATKPSPTLRPLPNLGRPVEVGAFSDASAPSRVQRVGMRWAAIAAAIALLLATAAGGYLATRGPWDGGPARVPGFAQACPAAGEWVDGCPGQPYFPCGVDPEIGRALVTGTLFPTESTQGTSVTMLGWQVRNGETVTWDPADPQIVPGVAIDIVVDGAYAATFSGPVAVQYADPLGGGSYEYPDPGVVIELSEGDSVSFAQGTRLEVTNRLTTRPLIFKSIVVHGDVEQGTTEPNSGQVLEGNPMGGSVTYQVNGTGTIPMPIGQYPRQEFGVALTYSQIYPDFPLPTTVGDSAVILGPVDPTDFAYPEVTPEEGTEGYILWLVIPKG